MQSKLVWTDGREVGVSFERNDAVGTPFSNEGELLTRMARLEDEIVSLKRMLQCLQNEVIKTEAA